MQTEGVDQLVQTVRIWLRHRCRREHFCMKFTKLFGLGVALASLVTLSSAKASTWFALGPYGGDARSFALDPSNSKHLYLGTADGWVYESKTGGDSWERLTRLGKRDDMVVDHIIVDPLDAKHLIAGAWVLDRADGGIFESNDSGQTWYEQAEMRGQSVRSLTISASDPHMLVAGTLKGVFRSSDSGVHWAMISPEGSAEIHEIESVAVDPKDPKIIYAGTWHLPWKTEDGGQHWFSIKNGIIEDSDVFSIIVDPKNPQVVYASACSGIYKSTDAGMKFTGGVTINKTQGLPATARRTRKLLQDPMNMQVVYAGTTEGLYRSSNGGASWTRLTNPEVIVNDVFVDPKNEKHVLIATDRGGVLESQNGGSTFEAANAGFSARQVSAYTQDPAHPGTVYVGVVNDKTAGGVFMSDDGGLKWQQQSAGLGGRDVFSLHALPTGEVLAGTNHGIYKLANGVWTDSGVLAIPASSVPVKDATPIIVKHTAAESKRTAHSPRRAAAKVAPKPPEQRLDEVVFNITGTPEKLYAGSAQGVLISTDGGKAWAPAAGLQMPETRYVATSKSVVAAASLKRMEVSDDAGQTWNPVTLPGELTQVSSIAADDLGNLWVGGREGVYYSTDKGANWKTLRNLYVTEVSSVFYDAPNRRILVTAKNATTVFAAHLPDYAVSHWDTGWNLRFARPVGDHLLAATLYDGMIVQPKMVTSQSEPASEALGSGMSSMR